MLSNVNSNQRLAAARLVELLDPNAPWHRSIWSLGTVLLLREVLEGSEAVRAGILSEESIKELGRECLAVSGKDPAVTGQNRRLLQQSLRACPRFQGLEYHTVRQLAEDVAARYLDRWAAKLEGGEDQPQPERIARCIAAHLLDMGYASNYLHRWWRNILFVADEPLTFSECLRRADSQLAQRPTRQYEVLIAFENAPRSKSGYPDSWLTGEAVSDWLKDNGCEVAGVRPSGGMVLIIDTRDPESAAQRATETVDYLVARASVGAGQVLRPWPHLWVRGETSSFDMKRRSRGVRVRALYREDQVLCLPEGKPEGKKVDAAIELLAHLETSSASAAVAGGWAAIEALLSEPDNRRVAAERLAALVACSFPRAELTALSYVVETKSEEMAKLLRSCKQNRDRCAVVGDAIINGRELGLRRLTDRAALVRMERLLKTPSTVLLDVKHHVQRSFERLYRQRNLVLHGGRTDGVTLHASLRTASKLVGAGIDRVAHAWYISRIDPIQLAARARVAMATVHDGDVEGCLDLLG